MNINDFYVVVATAEHISYAKEICEEMSSSAKKRGTGIARRNPEYVARKMMEGKAVIAFYKDGRWAGFSYIESWEGEQYVANSGLIINPEFRKLGLATLIKRKTFALSLKLYRGAKLFGLTTGLAVMKINSELGYKPVTYLQLTKDDKFWKGCESCVNYEVLKMKNYTNCLCTAMIFDPKKETSHFNIDEILRKERFDVCDIK
ncbi:MAG: GNAT family N-acetyltransferase [Rikenellaceae bacterium]